VDDDSIDLIYRVGCEQIEVWASRSRLAEGLETPRMKGIVCVEDDDEITGRRLACPLLGGARSSMISAQ
jgi:hypothetical protein